MCAAQIEVQEAIMPVKIAIYEPPGEGFPHLIVTFTSDGLNVVTANSSAEARAMVSERMIRRRRERNGEELSVRPSRPA
jgi:hypothetical protein